MRQFLRNNGLSLSMFVLFLFSFVGQGLAGWRHDVDERRTHGREGESLNAYLASGAFVEATFENWESEFLQMAAFVILSSVLVQRGAAESKKPEGEDESDPVTAKRHDSPWPVHRGGLALALYSRSLSIALGALFVFSFALHAWGGAHAYNEDALMHGQPTISVAGFLVTSTFWFQSLQNWQSEFLSVGVLVVLSIFLRQKGSPESKAVHAPHAQTGAEA